MRNVSSPETALVPSDDEMFIRVRTLRAKRNIDTERRGRGVRDKGEKKSLARGIRCPQHRRPEVLARAGR